MTKVILGELSDRKIEIFLTPFALRYAPTLSGAPKRIVQCHASGIESSSVDAASTHRDWRWPRPVIGGVDWSVEPAVRSASGRTRRGALPARRARQPRCRNLKHLCYAMNCLESRLSFAP